MKKTENLKFIPELQRSHQGMPLLVDKTASDSQMIDKRPKSRGRMLMLQHIDIGNNQSFKGKKQRYERLQEITGKMLQEYQEPYLSPKRANFFKKPIALKSIEHMQKRVPKYVQRQMPNSTDGLIDSFLKSELQQINSASEDSSQNEKRSNSLKPLKAKRQDVKLTSTASYRSPYLSSLNIPQVVYQKERDTFSEAVIFQNPRKLEKNPNPKYILQNFPKQVKHDTLIWSNNQRRFQSSPPKRNSLPRNLPKVIRKKSERHIEEFIKITDQNQTDPDEKIKFNKLMSYDIKADINTLDSLVKNLQVVKQGLQASLKFGYKKQNMHTLKAKEVKFKETIQVRSTA